MDAKTLVQGTAAATLLAFSAMVSADPIIVTLSDGNGVTELNGTAMTAFADPTTPTSDPNCSSASQISYAESPLGGQVDFTLNGGATACMSIEDPGWWEYDAQGNVYTTGEHWIELILPENTTAFYFYVGANTAAGGWIEAHDENNATDFVRFNSSPDSELGYRQTPGFGVYSSDSCTALTKIVIEPFQWGTGTFGIGQSDCVSVPEPAPIGLLGIGLLGMALIRRRSKRIAT